ncbi:MAG: L-lactate utilization protein LutC [Neolewinella sp.]|jgi:L-lactate utilization protein LutC
MPCTITFDTGRSRTADNELERIDGVPGATAMHFVVAADA